jgi:hypothetical protein
LSEMRIRTEKYRRSKKSPLEDYKSGCILLSQPYFFIRQDGILVPFNCSSTLHHKNPYGHGHLEKFALLRLTGEALPFAIHIPPTRVTMILAFAKRIEKGD